MTKKEIWLKRIIYALGIFCAGLFLITKSSFLLSAVTYDNTDYGEDWLRNKVDYFKIAIPDSPAELPNPNPDSVSVFSFGDSFFWLSIGFDRFSHQLSQKINQPVYEFGVNNGNVLEAFDRLGLNNDQPKILILGRVERNLINTYRRRPNHGKSPSALRSFTEYTKPFFDKGFRKANDNASYLWQHNQLSSAILGKINTYKLNQWGVISPLTPAWDTTTTNGNTPIVFFEETSTSDPHNSNFSKSYFSQHNDNLIENLSNNIAETIQILETDYNTRVIFVPIPNDISIYHNRITDIPYDNFLPRFATAVNQKSINVIHLYDDFISASESSMIYYPNDPHWTQKGLEIALEKVVLQIDIIAQNKLLK